MKRTQRGSKSLKRSSIGLIAALVIGVLLLAACGDNGNDEGDESSSNTSLTDTTATSSEDSEGDAGDAYAERRSRHVNDGEIDLEGTPVVAMFTSLDNDYYSSWDMGARWAVEALGGEYRALTNEGDPARQISQFEQQLQAGAQIFFITAPDPANIPALMAAAEVAEADIHVVNTHEMPEWRTPWDYGDSYVSYFTLNNITAGYETAKALFEEMGGTGGLIHLSGWPGATPDWQRTAGLHAALDEYPDIELLDSQPGNWNRDDARQVMAGLITAHGDEIAGVFAQNDDVGIGAMNALEEAGTTGIPVTGIDGNLETMGLISEGRYFGAYTQFPFWQAGYSAVKAIDAYLGWTPTAPERDMFTAGKFITASEAEAYEERFFSDEDPFDWHLMSQVAHPDDWDPQNQVWPMDLEEMWGEVDQPEGWAFPSPLQDAIDSGEFAEITELYEARYQSPIFETSD